MKSLLLFVFSFASLSLSSPKEKFCPAMKNTAMMAILGIQKDPKITEAQIESAFKENFCNQTNCLSYCSDPIPEKYNDLVKPRNECRNGSANACAELVVKINEKYEISPDWFCERRNAEDCQLSKAAKCWLIGGKTCYDEIKIQKPRNYIDLGFFNISCRSGIKEACSAIDKYLEDESNAFTEQCKLGIPPNCKDHVQKLINRGKKDETMAIVLSTCLDPKLHHTCFFHLKEIEINLKTEILNTLKSKCEKDPVPDSCLSYGFEIENSQPDRAHQIFSTLCKNSDLEKAQIGYYSCHQEFTGLLKQKKLKDAQGMVSKICKYAEKTPYVQHANCDAPSLLNRAKATGDKLIENSSCAHNGLKAFMDQQGNEILKLNCKKGLRNGISEFGSSEYGTDQYSRMHMMEYKNGIVHGKVLRPHYSLKYKIEYTAKDGIIDGSMVHLNQSDRFSYGKKVGENYKDGLIHGLSVSEFQKKTNFNEGIPVDEHQPDNEHLKNRCGSFTSKMSKTDLTNLMTIKNCDWPNKTNITYDTKEGLVVARKTAMKNGTTEISRFIEGFVSEKVICDSKNKRMLWEKYAPRDSTTYGKNDRPFFKQWSIPLKNDLPEGSVKYYEHARSYESNIYKNGKLVAGTLTLGSIRCPK